MSSKYNTYRKDNGRTSQALIYDENHGSRLRDLIKNAVREDSKVRKEGQNWDADEESWKLERQNPTSQEKYKVALEMRALANSIDGCLGEEVRYALDRFLDEKPVTPDTNPRRRV